MRLTPILLAVFALTACGGSGARSPEDVARAWSAALDRGDAGAAADLFARGARIVQTTEVTLDTRADAVRWNAALPCGGTITSVRPSGRDAVLVVFHLSNRPRHTCDAPGSDAAAIFEVRHGKIVLWHQTDVPSDTTV